MIMLQKNKLTFDDFIFQKIVNFQGEQDWVEMLYRPVNKENFSAETFFKKMSSNDQLLFDIAALKIVAKKQKASPEVLVSVNISPETLSNNLFWNKAYELVSCGDLNPSKLCVEVLESGSLRDLTSYQIKAISSLRAQGMKLALDDFGNGVAHWELLKHDLVDIVKIPNNKVNNETALTSSPQKFLTSLVTFADSLGLTTVLEGIETHDDLEEGVQFGCHNFQGFLFSGSSERQSVDSF